MKAPEEIWLKIFSNIQIDHDWTRSPWLSGISPREAQHSLATLCRVSKTFHRIAQPLLYGSLFVDFITRKHLLFRTFCERPDLSLLANSLTIGDNFIGYEPGTCDAFRSIQGTLGLPSELETQMLERGKNEEAHALISMALALVPNVKRLDVVIPYESDLLISLFDLSTANLSNDTIGGHGPTLGQTGGRPPLCFKDLSELTIRHWDTEYAVDVWAAKSTWRYPTIKSLNGFMTDWSPSDVAAPEKTGLRHIYLVRSLIDGESLSTLLSVCPDLESLEINWGDSTVGDSELDFSAMGNALRQHRRGQSKLRVLKLDPSEAFSYEEHLEEGRVGSLQELKCLTELTIPYHVLVGQMPDSDDEDGDDEEEQEEEEDDDDDGGQPLGDSDGASSLLRLERVLPKSLEELALTGSADVPSLTRDLVSLIGSADHRSLRKILVNSIPSSAIDEDVGQEGWVQTGDTRLILKRLKNSDTFE